MNLDTEAIQQKVVDLGKGLFCIQYKEAEDEACPPWVAVKPASGHERSVELLLHPDANDSILWRPGSSLVVRTSSAAKLQVEVVPLRPGGSRAASVRVEPLTQGEPRSDHLANVDWDFDAQASTVDGLRVLGHVAGIGDVSVNANEWIAGPMAPSRIEGISIQWPTKPRDLDIRYTVKTAAQTGVARMVDLGNFAGTRGRALPVTGIVIELSGQGAGSIEIISEAVFLSAPILRAVGQRVVLTGPTGREPLVGLRLAIQKTGISVNRAPATADGVAVPPSYSDTSTKGKVRVFRSRPTSGLAAG
jgi:hypothetical protein